MICEKKKAIVTKKMFDHISPHADQIKSLVVEMLRKMSKIAEEQKFNEIEESTIILSSGMELMICGLLLMTIRAPESAREEITDNSLQSINDYIKSELAIRLPEMELGQH